MWQIPSDEINRPGNFSTHAERNLSLLLEVMSSLNELHPLSYFSQHLKNKPDSTRQYMRDDERLAVFKKVRTYCLVCAYFICSSQAVHYSVQALKAKEPNILSFTQEEVWLVI